MSRPHTALVVALATALLATACTTTRAATRTGAHNLFAYFKGAGASAASATRARAACCTGPTSDSCRSWSTSRRRPTPGRRSSSTTWRPGSYLVVWASTIPGRYPATDRVGGGGRYDPRLYAVATRDFATFAPARLFYERGFSVIDAVILRVSARYVMWLKDETERPPQKNIRLAFAHRPEGRWSAPGAPITGDSWAEGPTVLRVGGRWHLHFDRYREHRYGLLVSDDLRTWTDATDRLRVPDGIRHGTAFEIPTAEARRLLAAEQPRAEGRP